MGHGNDVAGRMKAVVVVPQTISHAPLHRTNASGGDPGSATASPCRGWGAQGLILVASVAGSGEGFGSGFAQGRRHLSSRGLRRRVWVLVSDSELTTVRFSRWSAEGESGGDMGDAVNVEGLHPVGAGDAHDDHAGDEGPEGDDARGSWRSGATVWWESELRWP